MTTYKSIKGFKVQSYAANPVPSVNGWSTGGALNTGRNNSGGCGTATAALVAGGADDPLGYTNTTEQYDGTSWTEVVNYPTARQHMGTAGSQTAGMFIGGKSPNSAECFFYDGTSYAATGSLGTAKGQGASCGIQTAAIYSGGEIPALTATTELFNGSTWSAGNSMNTARNNNCTFGSKDDAVTVGGSQSGAPAVMIAEEYNGTSWAATGILNQFREGAAEPGAGTASTNGMIAGGASPTVSPDALTSVENYNGTSWSTNAASLSIERSGGFGTRAPTTSYLVTGGVSPATGYITSTEVYTEYGAGETFMNSGQVFYNTTDDALRFTASSGSWASAPSTITGRRNAGGAGVSDAMLIFGGTPNGYPSVSGITELYDGTSWAEQNDMNIGRTNLGSMIGVSTSAMAVSGYLGSPSSDTADVEAYDGTCWAQINDVQKFRHSGAAMGATNTQGLFVGGNNYPPGAGPAGYVNDSESFNGTCWAESSDINTGRRYLAGGGPPAAAIIFGGGDSSPALGVTENYNGTSWSTSPAALNTARRYLAGGGGPSAQTQALAFGGFTGAPATTAVTESFDGTTWSEESDLASAQGGMAASTAGTSSSMTGCMGGPPPVTSTETFSVGLSIKTVTVS